MNNKDTFGPEYALEVYDQGLGMRGFLVIDNLARGPGKGGIRMTSTVTKEEVARLARTMTWKNALAGIPFGGAKAGIVWPPFAKASEGKPGGSAELKKKFVQSFARKIRMFMPRYYIAGPDVNTGEKEMQWFVEATGNWRSATGKPANLCMKLFGKPGERCGIPHEFGSTGFGIAHAAAIAARLKGVDIQKATVAIHGFGNVGSFAFKYLTEMGATVVAVADRDGAVYLPSGLKEKILQRLKSQGEPVTHYPDGKKIDADALFALNVDILIPASVTDVIHAGNKDRIKAKIIVEGGNIPMQERIEDELFRRDILIVPDLVANAGGVISSYAEYRGYNPKRMFEMVRRKITASTKRVLERSRQTKGNPRTIAQSIAEEKVRAAMSKRSSGIM